jgi:hypothetical protein
MPLLSRFSCPDIVEEGVPAVFGEDPGDAINYMK